MIYLDYNATTPTHPRVIDAMSHYMKAGAGNPASVNHVAGLKSLKVAQWARGKLADLLHCPARNILFTSGATEANNIAIRSLIRDDGYALTTAVEHSCVDGVFSEAVKAGVRVDFLQPDETMLVSPEQVDKKSFKSKTVRSAVVLERGRHLGLHPGHGTAVL